VDEILRIYDAVSGYKRCDTLGIMDSPASKQAEM
jgi:hypothetical protein